MGKKINTPASRLRLQITATLGLALVLVWLIAWFDVDRNRQRTLHEAESGTVSDARIFAEYSRSTIKRLNEFVLDARAQWQGDAVAFADFIQRRQEHINDIAFQVAVIDRDGILAFSNLAASSERVDLSQREHFRVHAQAPDQDRLFISKPVKGKVSGKWSIQFTRPIFKNGQFDGVLVVSVSPEQFSIFAESLRLGQRSALSIVRESGQMMARSPTQDSTYELVIKNRPFLKPDAPLAGTGSNQTQVDGVDRVYGYYRLPDYGMIFIVGQAKEDVLQPHRKYRNQIVGIALFVSLLLVLTGLATLRSLRQVTESKRDIEQARAQAEQARAQAEEARKQAEEARERAERASQAKSTFLANMSHELRTPMNGIMGMTHLALRKATDPKQQEHLGRITTASRHLLGVINDILDISKIEAHRLTLDQVNFHLSEVLDGLISMVHDKAVEKGLQLDLDLPADLENLPLRGDKQRLGQILLNLTSNAIKFTEHGTVSVRARLAQDHPGEVLLRFEVQDTGIGISAEDQQRIFSAFEQADTSTTRKYGGTGLGLAISKRLIEQMGGTVGIESTVGTGSTFWYTVRLAKTPLAPAPAQESPAQTVEELLKARHAGAHILLAEDEPINQEITCALLEQVGLRVDIAVNGSEAVALAQLSHYDLILMDMQMPEMNGLDATRAIRLVLPNAHTPIVALTANAFEQDRQRCLDAGMNDHISKPIEPDLLFVRLLKWLDHPRG